MCVLFTAENVDSLFSFFSSLLLFSLWSHINRLGLLPPLSLRLCVLLVPLSARDGENNNGNAFWKVRDRKGTVWRQALRVNNAIKIKRYPGHREKRSREERKKKTRSTTWAAPLSRWSNRTGKKEGKMERRKGRIRCRNENTRNVRMLCLEVDERRKTTNQQNRRTKKRKKNEWIGGRKKSQQNHGEMAGAR